MLKIQRNMVPSLLARHKGKFFSCTFTKKDGTKRDLHCRIGAIAGHDDLNPVAHLSQYVTVTTLENGKTEFKNINVHTMENLNIAGNKYTIIG